MSEINFEQDQVDSITQIDSSKKLSDKVIALKNLEDEIENAERSVSKLKENAKQLSGVEIPTLMAEMHISKLKLKDGSAVEVKPFYSASIMSDKTEEAFNWLRDHGHGDIIKNDVTVTFGRGEDNKASEYADLAKGNGFEPTQKLKVEPMTLKALFRERSEKNEELPSEHFNLFKGNKTKITRSK
jgi:hypothetical protein